jgi:hypothetical protein
MPLQTLIQHKEYINTSASSNLTIRCTRYEALLFAPGMDPSG